MFPTVKYAPTHRNTRKLEAGAARVGSRGHVATYFVIIMSQIETGTFSESLEINPKTLHTKAAMDVLHLVTCFKLDKQK